MGASAARAISTEEFTAEFKRLLAAFPYFQPAAAKEISKLWRESLGEFSREAVHASFDQVILSGEQYMPPLGKVVERCEKVARQMRSLRIRDCKHCEGKGFVIVEERGVSRARHCECNPQ